MKLSEAEETIRAALERLADSPRESRCFVIIESTLTKRFVQFCTPPPVSRFAGQHQFPGEGPIIFDGGGDGKPGGYEPAQWLCTAEQGVGFALTNLKMHLPQEAELRIIEESAPKDRPS